MESKTGQIQPDTPESLILDYEAVIHSPAPFARSLQMILETIGRQTGADVACLYTYEAHRLKSVVSAGSLTRSISSLQIRLSARSSEWLWTLPSIADLPNAGSDWRVSSFPEVILNSIDPLNGIDRFVVAPLRIGGRLAGILTAGWRRYDSDDDTASRLIHGLSASATELLARSRYTEESGDLITQIAQLEAELADLKIADRATEILAQRGRVEQTVDIVHRHVRRVLEGTDSASALRRQLQELRTQVHDRRLVNRAKAFLQHTRHLTEEEAYFHLRNLSRRERRPIRDIAHEILAEGAHARRTA